MSSIMDELKKLQGKRAASPPPPTAPEIAAPMREALRAKRYSRALGVLVGLAVLGATLVVLKSARPSRGPDAATTAVTEKRSAQNEPETQLAMASVAETPVPNEAQGAEHDAPAPVEDPEPVEAIEETLPESVEQTSPDAVPSPSRELVEAASPEPVEAASPEPVEAASPEPVEAAPPKAPVRMLTQAEHEANMTAIRGLRVLGVFEDGKGVAVYTSAGELRAGEQFNEMDITEVTLKYVVFECGNKRYKWMLPR